MDVPVVDERQRVHFAIPRGGIQVSDLLTMVSDYPYDAVVSLSYAVDQLSFDGLGVIIDRDKRTISGPNGVFTPSKTEFDIVEFLADHADVVQSREEIAKNALAKQKRRDLHTVDVHISHAKARMHEKAGIPPEVIRTVRGVGFMFRSHIAQVLPVFED